MLILHRGGAGIACACGHHAMVKWHHGARLLVEALYDQQDQSKDDKRKRSAAPLSGTIPRRPTPSPRRPPPQGLAEHQLHSPRFDLAIVHPCMWRRKQEFNKMVRINENLPVTYRVTAIQNPTIGPQPARRLRSRGTAFAERGR